MDNMGYFIVDIETCPIDLDNYQKLDEEEKKKKLNPIDSKIVAIGLRYAGKDIIFSDEDEKKILEDFWLEWKSIKKSNFNIQVVGFNINNFDLPFLVTRSFIHNVIISPFTIKSIIDLKEKVTAYRYGHTRGKLKEFALFMGLEDFGMDGSEVADLCIKKDFDKLKEYLKNDLKITDEMYKRIKSTNILNIVRW